MEGMLASKGSDKKDTKRYFCVNEKVLFFKREKKTAELLEHLQKWKLICLQSIISYVIQQLQPNFSKLYCLFHQSPSTVYQEIFAALNFCKFFFLVN